MLLGDALGLFAEIFFLLASILVDSFAEIFDVLNIVGANLLLNLLHGGLLDLDGCGASGQEHSCEECFHRYYFECL